MFLNCHFSVRGNVEYFTPFGRMPENVLNSEASNAVGTIHPQVARAGVDTGVSLNQLRLFFTLGSIEKNAHCYGTHIS